MGGADIIPGVSGGTVALIVGIYDRLVTAISHIDMRLLAHLKHKDWNAAAKHVDLRFLVALGSGIVLGIGSLSSLMHYLLEYQRQPTYAVFFGLIVASTFLVARMVQSWSAATLACLIGGAVASYFIVGLPFLQDPPEGNLYVFFCGTIAICAMILPGISGAFILLVLGIYSDITALLRGFLHGDFTTSALITLVVFITGCLIGLISFSKFLRWLLRKHESVTMALLCGIMVGSLKKIWPFKTDLTPNIDEFKNKQWQDFWPQQLSGDVIAAVLLAVAAAGLIFFLHWLTHRSRREFVEESRNDEVSQATRTESS